MQRYRTVLLAVIGLPAAALAILISASIVIELFATPRAAADRATPGAAEQLACNREVQALLDRLVREAARVELTPLESRGDIGQLGASWDAFSGEWDAEWRAAEARCRFAALADRGLGTAFDRMAWVHRSLPTTKLKYAEQMARFSRDLAPEVAEMRRALDKSHADLEKRSAGKDEERK